MLGLVSRLGQRMKLSGRSSVPQADGTIPHADTTSQPSPVEWLAAVGVSIIQQVAFIFVPSLMAGLPINPSTLGDTPNPVNTVAVAANGLVIGALCLIHRRQAMSIARGNWASALLAILIFASTLWSIHPEITFRRAGGYLITMLTAVFLSSRFTTDQVIRVLSWGLALSAIGSIAFVAIYPQYGIMQGQDLEGDLDGTWRGVFTHKNPMGYAMCIGVFVECYIIASASTGIRRHTPVLDICLLACFCALVILSRSATALLCSVFYLIGSCGYVLWVRARPIAAIASTAAALLTLLALVVVWVDPISALALMGKDATLTGRTDLWPLVLDLIWQKPVWGWGYGALWLAGDNTTIAIAAAIGWTPPNAHNEFLQVASELGLLGAAVVLIVIAVALRRGASCIIAGRQQLGVFLLMFVLATVITGITEEMLVQNQTISWVVFNILSFSAGLELARLQEQKEQPERRIERTILARAKPVGDSSTLTGLQ